MWNLTFNAQGLKVIIVVVQVTVVKTYVTSMEALWKNEKKVPFTSYPLFQWY
jgi:hypothetical protein